MEIPTFWWSSKEHIQRFDEIEKEQPGTRHSLLKGMEKIRKTCKSQTWSCPSCGEPSEAMNHVYSAKFATFTVFLIINCKAYANKFNL